MVKITAKNMIKSSTTTTTTTKTKTKTKTSAKAAVKQVLDTWMGERGWKPFKFQREVWQAIAQGPCL